KAQGSGTLIDAQGVTFRPPDYQLNLPITAGNTTISSFTITNVPAGEVIRDATVRLTINHPHPENLEVLLQAPNGTIVALSAFEPTNFPPSPFTPLANFLNTTFDDHAALPISTYKAPPPYTR